jgi:hypothetical protein
VIDPSGAAIAGASVEARGPYRPYVTETDSAGAYLFASLPPTDYAVTITPSGFAPFHFPSVEIGVGDRVRLDADLRLKPVNESLEVTAGAPPVEPGQTLTSESVGAEMYAKLPNGHAVDSLLWLSSGVLADFRAGGFQVDGASGAENVFVVDGVEASSIFDGTLSVAAQIPTEWIAEVQVKRGGVDSQFGGAIGGVVNAVTRSGGDQWHSRGSLYMQSDAFNAGPRPWLVLNPFNDNQAGYFHPSRDGFRGLTPGYLVGGPPAKKSVVDLQ